MQCEGHWCAQYCRDLVCRTVPYQGTRGALSRVNFAQWSKTVMVKVWMRVFTGIKLMMKCEIGIEWMVSWSTQCGRPLPLNRRAGMRVCTMVCLHWGVWWDQGSPMVCCLWLMEMSGTCGCFHDSAIHMCVPLYQSPQSTHTTCQHSVAEVRPWGPDDYSLYTCLLFGDHSFSSNAFSNHSFPLFLLLQQPFLALSTCLSHLLRMHILEE